MKVVHFSRIGNDYRVRVSDTESDDPIIELTYGGQIPSGLTKEQHEAQIIRESILLAKMKDAPAETPVSDYQGLDLDAAAAKAETKRKK